MSRSGSRGPWQKVTASGRMRHLLERCRTSPRVRSGPGARGFRLRLVGVDRGLLLHREADIVEAVHQAVLAERVDLEFHRAAVGPADFLIGKTDGHRSVAATLGVVEQFVEIV